MALLISIFDSPVIPVSVCKYLCRTNVLTFV